MKLTSINLAERFGMMSVGEVQLLKRVVRETTGERPVCLNIGAGVGTSTVAIFEERPRAIVFSVDKKSHAREIESLVGAGFWSDQSSYYPLSISSQHLGAYWDRPLDLLFIDGAHDNQSAERDFRLFRPWLSDEGIFCFHDYDHSRLPALKVLIDELIKESGGEIIGKERYLVCVKERLWKSL